MGKLTVRQTLSQLIAHQRIAEKDVPQAIELARIHPEPEQWQGFLNRLLLWAGALGLGCGSVFFVAANWQYMGHLAKFALIEVLILACALVYWRIGTRPHVAKASLVAAMLGVGGLMALYGQTYQTGADPWQLFFNWAMVTLPWVLVSRFAPIWLLWLLLLNAASSMYFNLWAGSAEVAHAGFILNTLCLVIWQLGAKYFLWLDKAWAINIVAAISAYFSTWLYLESLFSDDFSGLIFCLLWAVGIFYAYRFIHLNLFILSIWCLCLIIAINSLLLKIMDENFISLSFFILSAITIGGGSYSAIWLKGLLRRGQHE